MLTSPLETALASSPLFALISIPVFLIVVFNSGFLCFPYLDIILPFTGQYNFPFAFLKSFRFKA